MATTLYIDFSDAQGQITPESVVGSRRNTNSSKRLCMSSLPEGGAGGLVVEPRTPEREVGVRYLPPLCCVLEQDTFTPRIVLMIPRKRWLRPDMTEKLFTGTLSINKSLASSMIIQTLMHILITCKYEYGFYQKQPRKCDDIISRILSLCFVFSRSRAANSVVHGPI